MAREIIPILIFAIPIVAIIAGTTSGILRMRHVERMAKGRISEDDAAEWRRTVERLEARMKVLESILDDEAPGWRRKHHD